MWVFNFRQDFLDDEIQDLATLSSLCQRRYFFQLEKNDKRLWSPDPKGKFSVKTFYDVAWKESYWVMMVEFLE